MSLSNILPKPHSQICKINPFPARTTLFPPPLANIETPIHHSPTTTTTTTNLPSPLQCWGGLSNQEHPPVLHKVSFVLFAREQIFECHLLGVWSTGSHNRGAFTWRKSQNVSLTKEFRKFKQSTHRQRYHKTIKRSPEYDCRPAVQV